MKRILIFPIAIALIVGCNSSDTSSSNKADSTSTTTPATTDLSSNPDYQKGLQLEAVNDCKTCHGIDTKIQGPSFREIANKYGGMPDTIVSHLANKIITGGGGEWGEILMTPHPTLPKEDAEAIVKYILLLKK